MNNSKSHSLHIGAGLLVFFWSAFCMSTMAMAATYKYDFEYDSVGNIELVGKIRTGR